MILSPLISPTCAGYDGVRKREEGAKERKRSGEGRQSKDGARERGREREREEGREGVRKREDGTRKGKMDLRICHYLFIFNG